MVTTLLLKQLICFYSELLAIKFWQENQLILVEIGCGLIKLSIKFNCGHFGAGRLDDVNYSSGT